VEHYRLEHPAADQLILCTHSTCEDIADYVEVNETWRENFVCAAHTSSERHASVLPKRVPCTRNASESTCYLGFQCWQPRAFDNGEEEAPMFESSGTSRQHRVPDTVWDVRSMRETSQVGSLL
jgi:hypothetical protein